MPIRRGSPSPEGWRLIRRALREQRAGIAVGVAAGIVWAIAKASVPLLVQEAIDNGITPKDTAVLWRWTAAIFVSGVVAALFTGVRRYSAFRESRLVEAKLRDAVFAHTQRLHFAYHDHQQTGELMSRANTDLFQIQNFVVLIPLTISNFITVVFVTGVLLFIDPVLTVLALGSLPLLNYLGKRFSTKLHPSVMAIQRESAELATVVEETVSGVRVVKGFGSQAAQSQRLTKEANDIYDVSMEAARVRARYLPAMDLLPTVGFIFVLGYGGYQVLNGGLLLGEMVAFTAYIGLLIWPLRMLGMIIAQSQRAAASAQRVHEVLSTDSEITSPRAPTPLPRKGTAKLGAVSFDDVVFRYRGGVDAAVLDHLDLRVEPGESVALVGATGSGKSTVARLLPRFYDVESGRVRLDGLDVRQLDLLQLRRAIGIVFEDTFLFSATIADNIAFADPLAKDDAIERAARLSGAHDFIVDLPDGYATEIGERGFSLSGGQRQRIAIARAILADPRVLILDDATSSVDPTKEHEIRDALTEVMHNRTTIVIAHRPATIALADRVVLLGEGKVLVEGTHDELLQTSASYRAVLAAAEAYDAERARHEDEDEHELEGTFT
ncbi:MAG: ABC transporter ATP-binding protein [Actinobacteria bacterium]|nr:ABC transporter ATP-binding protein [Actinomycetota bacterium]